MQILPDSLSRKRRLARKRRLVAQASSVLAALLLASQPVRSEPFSFRGIQLGTTLADLRRIQFPEAPGSRLLCSHDAEAAQIRPTPDYQAPDDEANANVIVCGFYIFAKALGPNSGILPPEWLLSRLNVGPIDATPLFWLVPERDKDVEETARLYRIVIHSNSSFWAETRAAFVRRYGPPTQVTTAMLQQPGKRDIAAETVSWINADSSIRLLQRNVLATRMTILFEQTKLVPGQ